MATEHYLAEPSSPSALKPLWLSQNVIAVIEQHSVKEFPYECCGFLFGRDDELRHITLARPVTNSAVENQSRRFEIKPKDYMEAELFAENSHLSLLGVYHSHPEHPAVPSLHDFRQAVPGFSYIITSVLNGKVEVLRSWQLDQDGLFAEEKIQTEINSNY